MVIDFHVHLAPGPDAVDRLLRAMDENGIDMAVIFSPRNDDVFAAAQAHPDRLIPFGQIGWGFDDPREINRLYERGAKGMKVIRPRVPYNDSSLEEYWGRAEELGMPLLVHTGIVARHATDRWDRVDTSYMNIINLDGPCRWFPRLNIVAAHMGNPHHEDASMMIRWHPNLYFDLSGSSLLHRSHQYFRELFWWDKPTRFSDRTKYRPFEKMVFGSDEPYEIIGEPLAEQRALLEALEQPPEIIEGVFGGTAARLLGLSE